MRDMDSPLSSEQWTKAMNAGKWPVDNNELTEGQINAALAVVKANALNDSDYAHLKEMLGL